jgi:hypothetical protein
MTISLNYFNTILNTLRISNFKLNITILIIILCLYVKINTRQSREVKECFIICVIGMLNEKDLIV